MTTLIASMFLLAGLAAVAAGAWMIAPPAGLIVGGTLTAAVALAWTAGSDERATDDS